ncbi:MAG: hypothetical protein KAR00_02415 [Candidatus Pacebacteria bacterium]|nr:hypothetical protein [Candidatus Paceibacterota bacterium]
MKERNLLTIKIIFVVILSISIVVYAFYQARNLIQGPTITIGSPANGSLVASPIVVIQGIASNISSIQLNDSPIFVDEDGVFKEKLILSSGYNIIKLSASDRFGREKERLLQLMFKPE